jgi:hypothetical protein
MRMDDPGVILEDDARSSPAIGRIVIRADDGRAPGGQSSHGMRTWTATAAADAHPAALLDVLTDPDACARWAPVPFDVDSTRRLAAGTRTTVSGKLAGQRIGFDVEVHRADDTGLALSARGPVHFDVDYRLGGSTVDASISVRPGRGLKGRLLAEATGALLSAGALQNALSRLVREAAIA